MLKVAMGAEVSEREIREDIVGRAILVKSIAEVIGEASSVESLA